MSDHDPDDDPRSPLLKPILYKPYHPNQEPAPFGVPPQTVSTTGSSSPESDTCNGSRPRWQPPERFSRGDAVLLSAMDPNRPSSYYHHEILEGDSLPLQTSSANTRPPHQPRRPHSRGQDFAPRHDSRSTATASKYGSVTPPNGYWAHDDREGGMRRPADSLQCKNIDPQRFSGSSPRHYSQKLVSRRPSSETDVKAESPTTVTSSSKDSNWHNEYPANGMHPSLTPNSQITSNQDSPSRKLSTFPGDNVKTASIALQKQQLPPVQDLLAVASQGAQESEHKQYIKAQLSYQTPEYGFDKYSNSHAYSRSRTEYESYAPVHPKRKLSELSSPGSTSTATDQAESGNLVGRLDGVKIGVQRAATSARHGNPGASSDYYSVSGSSYTSQPTPGSTTEGYASSSQPTPGEFETSRSKETPPTSFSTTNSSAAPSYKCTHEDCTAAPFATQYLLNSHMNVHSQNRPHYCPVPGCPRSFGGRGFKRKNEMKRHGLVHDSPGYVCPYCPDKEHRYPRPDNLQRHVRMHHEDKPKEDPLLADVLAQRPAGGPMRGRKRRGGGSGGVGGAGGGD